VHGEAAAYFDAFLADFVLDRVDPEADAEVLAPTLVGAAHLLFVGRDEIPPEPDAIRKVVSAVIGGVLREPR
jgi:hypothetical protein